MRKFLVIAALLATFIVPVHAESGEGLGAMFILAYNTICNKYVSPKIIVVSKRFVAEDPKGVEEFLAWQEKMFVGLDQATANQLLCVSLSVAGGFQKKLAEMEQIVK